MRTLLKVSLPSNDGATRAQAEDIQRVFVPLLQELKPEATYFCPENGRRSSFIVFDMKDPSQMPPIVERLTGQLGAQVNFSPVMNLEELKKGLESASAHAVAVR